MIKEFLKFKIIKKIPFELRNLDFIDTTLYLNRKQNYCCQRFKVKIFLRDPNADQQSFTAEIELLQKNYKVHYLQNETFKNTYVDSCNI